MGAFPVYSLLIVEDHLALARTVASLVQTQANVNVTGIVGSAEEALERLAVEPVDLVLVDVSLPGMNGLELVALIQRDYPKMRCLMLSGHVELEYVRRALAAGARGYVVKGKPLDLITGLRLVLAGEIYISDTLLIP